jgi:hypothetical protein
MAEESPKPQPEPQVPAAVQPSEPSISLFDRTTIGNVVAGVILLGGLAFAAYVQDSKLITFLVGAGVGYLFKQGSSS